ncbi:MAG: deoxynucleoside kinase [Bacteroidia bacterium]
MYICIEGNIGVGKTTVAKALAKKHKAVFLAERFEDNSLLPLFYKNKKDFAFPLEYSFLIDRYAQLNAFFKANDRKTVVADFSIYKCMWFAKTNLSKKDYAFYRKHFRIIKNQLPAPDLIVFLDTDENHLVKNIKKRGRNFESGIDQTYLAAVSENYRKGLKKLKQVPVLHIKLKAYTKDSTGKVIARIEKQLQNGDN